MSTWEGMGILCTELHIYCACVSGTTGVDCYTPVNELKLISFKGLCADMLHVPMYGPVRVGWVYLLQQESFEKVVCITIIESVYYYTLLQ